MAEYTAADNTMDDEQLQLLHAVGDEVYMMAEGRSTFRKDMADLGITNVQMLAASVRQKEYQISKSKSSTLPQSLNSNLSVALEVAEKRDVIANRLELPIDTPLSTLFQETLEEFGLVPSVQNAAQNPEKTAILSWGSLIWQFEQPGRAKISVQGEQVEIDDQDVKPAVTNASTAAFKLNGPTLRVEFARVSQDGRLTLVLQKKDMGGEKVQTWSATSTKRTVAAARRNLQKREGSGLRRIHYINLRNGSHEGGSDYNRRQISHWAQENGFDGVVWTGLDSNFAEKTGKAFDSENAVWYLAELGRRDAAAYFRAVEYIQNAPYNVQTPVRTAISTALENGDLPRAEHPP